MVLFKSKALPVFPPALLIQTWLVTCMTWAGTCRGYVGIMLEHSVLQG